MNENQPTTKQMVVFAVVLSFVVSIIGTVLSIGIFSSLFGLGVSESNTPFLFNRPGILERIKETVIQDKTSERVERQDELVVQVVSNASPAVVSVVATKDVPVVEKYFTDPFANDPFFKQFFDNNGGGLQVPHYRQNGTEKKEISAGTGFFVSNDGLIVTNKHVVIDPDAEYVVFMNDSRKLAAKVLARDPLQDLAVLKVAGSDFPFLKLGNSSQIKVGQSVIAIGNALGEFSNTVSVGVVSGLHRSVTASNGGGDQESLQELIQTDAAINPGNSGGPLINLHSEVIGINTAVAEGAQNIGFAIPVNQIARAVESVKTQGKIVYPFLGVRYIVITKDLAAKQKLAKDYGVLVSGGTDNPGIVPDGPAAKAGVKDGDIILEVNGERLDTEHALSAFIQKYHVGDGIILKIWRNGSEIEIKVKLEERK